MVVTGKVHNIHQLGPFIYRLCNGKDTYRLNRRVTHRRELELTEKMHLKKTVSHVRWQCSLFPFQAAVIRSEALRTLSKVMLLISPLSQLTGINKRDAKDCHHIRHFENTFVVETTICDEA